jgi:Mor family transcriptional regulator
MEFTMTVPERFAQRLQPLHPDGAEHAAAAALRLYLELGELGVKALQARAKHEGMNEAELIEHLLLSPNPDRGTITRGEVEGRRERERAPNYRQANNIERDRQIADEYFAGGTTYPKLAVKYGLSAIRITQIVTRARELRNI